jgi:hypothetical protein
MGRGENEDPALEPILTFRGDFSQAKSLAFRGGQCLRPSTASHDRYYLICLLLEHSICAECSLLKKAAVYWIHPLATEGPGYHSRHRHPAPAL